MAARKWYFKVEWFADDTWRWTLIGKDGPVAVGPVNYPSEAEARSAVARAKIAMRAARFASVVTA